MDDGFEALAGPIDGVGVQPNFTGGKSSGTSAGYIDPESTAGDEWQRDENGNVKYSERTGKPLRKRGRRSGSGSASAAGNSRKSKGDSKAVETLSQTLLIVHMGIASLIKSDSFALDQKESDALAASTANVLEQFDYTPDPRFTAVAGLVTTAGMIYGPRVYLLREESKKKAVELKEKKRLEQEQFTQQVTEGGVVPFGMRG